jgi:formylglycine-generating enzyme required for sulfatase activity
MPPHPPLKTFIIYAREDKHLRDEFLKHARVLEDEGLIRVWTDLEIPPGADWNDTIRRQLEQTALFLAFVSVDFYHSTYIQQTELPFANERRLAGQADLIPVLLDDCPWERYRIIRDLQVLPADGKPVTDTEHWKSRNKAWTIVVNKVAEHAEKLLAAAAPKAPKVKAPSPKAEARKPDEDTEQKRRAKAAAEAERQRAALALEALRANDPFHDLMVPIKGGTFNMGDTFGDGDSRELPVHPVTVPDFLLCKYPVTQAQWRRVMGTDPSKFKGDNLPVEQVSWDDAQAFIQKLNERTGLKYRLPTEAEWEYAAREAGKKVRFGNGKDIADPEEINFDGSAAYKQSYSKTGKCRQQTTPVGQFPPNALGLCDMSGNVWEWCEDRWHPDYLDAPDDGSAWISGAENARVCRGGSWFDDPRLARAAARYGAEPSLRYLILGFRPARD